jgi:hypothetical protein
MSGKLAAIALCLGLLCSARAHAQDDELGDLDDKPSKADSQAAEGGEADAEAEAAPGAAEPAAEGDSGPSVSIRPYAGIGIAMRSFERPISGGVQKLAASAVPGAEVGLTVVAWPAASFSLGFNLAYQTALGFTVKESPSFAMQNRTHARSEHVALDVAPTWRKGPLSIGVPIGLSMRTLWPEAHMLQTPGYSLIGPHARLELVLQAGERVSLRVAPEAQWITMIDEALRATGVNSQGVALGGEATLNVTLSDHWQAGVSYRESHALISSASGATFKDTERYLTLRGTGSF